MFLLLLPNHLANVDCNLMINDLNVDTLNENKNPFEVAKFIEFKAVGSAKNGKYVLEKFRILVIKGNGGRGSPEIEVANLQN